MGDKTNRLNICLIKAEFKSFDEIVDDETRSIAIEGVGTLYVVDSKPRQPDWVVDFFGNALTAQPNLLTSNAKGVLLCSIELEHGARIFAIVFGRGRYLLNEGVVEERFGLKVVLNTVRSNSLRSIDKTTLGSTPKQSREQVSREGSAASFGIDIEQDLVNAVTGASEDARLGKTISGREPSDHRRR